MKISYHSEPGELSTRKHTRKFIEAEIFDDIISWFNECEKLNLSDKELETSFLKRFNGKHIEFDDEEIKGPTEIPTILIVILMNDVFKLYCKYEKEKGRKLIDICVNIFERCYMYGGAVFKSGYEDNLKQISNKAFQERKGYMLWFLDLLLTCFGFKTCLDFYFKHQALYRFDYDDFLNHILKAVLIESNIEYTLEDEMTILDFVHKLMPNTFVLVNVISEMVEEALITGKYDHSFYNLLDMMQHEDSVEDKKTLMSKYEQLKVTIFDIYERYSIHRFIDEQIEIMPYVDLVKLNDYINPIVEMLKPGSSYSMLRFRRCKNTIVELINNASEEGISKNTYDMCLLKVKHCNTMEELRKLLTRKLYLELASYCKTEKAKDIVEILATEYKNDLNIDDDKIYKAAAVKEFYNRNEISFNDLIVHIEPDEKEGFFHEYLYSQNNKSLVKEICFKQADISTHSIEYLMRKFQLVLDKKLDDFVVKNTHKYENILKDKELRKELVLNFFKLANDAEKYYKNKSEIGNKVQACKPEWFDNEEKWKTIIWESIENNKDIVDTIAASQAYYLEFIDYKGFEFALDYSQVVFGVIKVVEKYLKEYLVHTGKDVYTKFSNGVPNMNEFVCWGIKNKNADSLGIQLGQVWRNIDYQNSISDSDYKAKYSIFKSSKESDDNKKQHNQSDSCLFNDEFVKQTRNGYGHIHKIDTWEQAKLVYAQTAFWLKLCIGELGNISNNIARFSASDKGVKRGKRIIGIVIYFNKDRGFGLIKNENFKKVFVHFGDLKFSGPKILVKGEKVEFDIVKTSKGFRAVNVIKILPVN